MALFLARYNAPRRRIMTKDKSKPTRNLPATVPRRKLNVIATPNRLESTT
ncbi:MAG: hypothetical protein IJK74_04760 [Bacteroidales bacterium]|nr:hypothetical protein [Bacteroidales bacterium]